MKNFIKYPFILLTLQLLVSCNEQNGSLSSLNKQDVHAKTNDLIKEYVDLGVFSGVVLIAQDGKPFYEKAFGLANRERNDPNSLETRFVIGSMNKSFTRVLVLQLIEEGRLNLTDKLVDFLDGFEQKDANKITVDHLLNHRSGFGDYHGPAYFDLHYRKKNIQGILDIIRKMDLQFVPGTGNEYSNAGYIVLGAIIEKITQKSYAINVEERIARTLKLKSLVTENVKVISNRAIGYMKTIDGYENNEDFISEPRSDGGFYANAYDILRFYRAFLYGNKLISKNAKKEDEFFKGIEKIRNEKGTGIPIAGGFNGANTVHLEMMADNISIVVLANMDEPVAENLALGILHIIKGRTPAKPVLPVKLNVYYAYKEKGVDYVKSNFDSLTMNWFEQDPKDLILNNIGYDLLFRERHEEALELFRLNTELFPKIANCWDSYGEALLISGDREGALMAYNRALEINPDFPSALKAVKELDK